MSTIFLDTVGLDNFDVAGCAECATRSHADGIHHFDSVEDAAAAHGVTAEYMSELTGVPLSGQKRSTRQSRSGLRWWRR